MAYTKCWINQQPCYETTGIQCKAFNYESQCVDKVNVYIKELQEKLHHRNQQIKELKKNNAFMKVTHPATVFECVHNTFIEHYPKTAPEHQAISHYCNKIQELLAD